MRYNEWRDELQNNLFNVTESERRRVLDYYAEAYADRREAGYSERQIIEDFGAPYDAAQRILLNIYDSREEDIEEERYNQFKNNRKSSRYSNERNQNYFEERENPRQNLKSKREPDFVEAEVVREERARKQDSDFVETNSASKNKNPMPEPRKNYTWVFVLLCIVFAIPLFALLMTMLGISISVIVTPFALLIGGLCAIGFGIFEMFSNFASGLFTVGEGLIVLGISIILIPLLTKLVKLMWKLFNRFFNWLGSLFSGKECVR